jgi:hypothetical protein
MQGNIDLALLAMEHLRFAGLLAGVFAGVTVAYLVAFSAATLALSRGRAWILHTLYLLWQSNVAFMAVVALSNGSRLMTESGALMAGWQSAPYRVPAAAMLYASILILSVAYAGLRGDSFGGSRA